MGALTLKPLENEVRQWELFENEGLDLTDGFGVSVRLATREGQVLFSEAYNVDQPWITDRGRMFFEGSSNKRPKPSSEIEIFYKEAEKVVFFLNHLGYPAYKSDKMLFTAVFKRLGLDVLFLLKSMESRFSFVRIRSETSFFAEEDFEESAQLTPMSSDKLQYSSLAILIGVNTRYEGHLLNLTLRLRFLKGGFDILSAGPELSLAVPASFFGSSYRAVAGISKGVHPICIEAKKSDLPMLVTNSSFFRTPSASVMPVMLERIRHACGSSGGLSVLANTIETTGKHYLGGFSAVSRSDFKNSKSLFYLNTDFEVNPELKSLVSQSILRAPFNNVLPSSKIIFNFSDNEDTPADARGKLKNIFKSRFSYLHLPGKTSFENSTTYMNTQGRSRKTFRVSGNTPVKTNWEIIRDFNSSFQKFTFLLNKKDSSIFSSQLNSKGGQEACFNFLFRATRNITSMSKELTTEPDFLELEIYPNRYLKEFRSIYRNFKVKPPFDDFFIGGNKDSLSTNSPTLIKCSKSVRSRDTNFF